MDDINFISNNINGGKDGKGKKTKGKIEWTKPKEESVEKGEKLKPVEKVKDSPGVFSFFKKNISAPLLENMENKAENKKETKVFEIKKADNLKKDIIKPAREQEKYGKPKPAKIHKTEKEKKSFISSIFGSGEKIEKSEKRAEESSKPSFNLSPKKWESSNVLETNLIEGEVILLNQLKKDLIIIFIFIALACLVVGASYKGLMLWGEEKKKRVQVSMGKINAINQEISRAEKKLAGIPKLLDSLKIAGNLLDSHIYWSNFFEFFNENTLENVSYEGSMSFARNTANSGLIEYSFTATADSFKTMVSQINFFRLNEYVKKVTVAGGRSGTEKESSEAVSAPAAQQPPKEGEISPIDMKKFSSTGEVSFNMTIALDPILFTRGPKISSIEPMVGSKGDYLTIRGINFKKQESAGGEVKFYNKETKKIINADNDFPSDCQNNWWHNSFVVVKIPDLDAGKWQVILENMDGESRYKEEFQAIKGDAGPGICQINPNYGFGEQRVEIFGDNFGDNQENKKVFLPTDIEPEIIDWSNNKITIRAPAEAKSGPLTIKSGQAKTSNSILFSQLK